MYIDSKIQRGSYTRSLIRTQRAQPDWTIMDGTNEEPRASFCWVTTMMNRLYQKMLSPWTFLLQRWIALLGSFGWFVGFTLLYLSWPCSGCYSFDDDYFWKSQFGPYLFSCPLTCSNGNQQTEHLVSYNVIWLMQIAKPPGQSWKPLIEITELCQL